MQGGATGARDQALRATAAGAGALAAAIGAVVVIGWAFDVRWLQSLHPSFVSMKFNTAICAVLLGIALWARARPSGTRRAIGVACALVASAIALASLTEHVLRIDLGIDQLLFADRSAPYGSPGRMAVPSAACIALLGAALATLDVDVRGRQPGKWLAWIAAAAATFGVIGYVNGVPRFYGMAAHTVLVLAVLGAGTLLARPSREPIATLRSRTSAGLLARRLMPVVVLAPAVLGLLRLWGERAGLYDTTFGLSLLVVGCVVLLAAVTGWATSSMRRAELAERTFRQAETEREAALARTRQLEEHAAELTDLTVQLDHAMRELEAFSYSVSHDLRTPLRSLDGFSQALLEDHADSLGPQAQDYLRRIRAAAQRMGLLIDDLLRLARVSRAQLSQDDVDLSALAIEIGSALAKAEPARNVAFSVHPDLCVRGDRELLRLALENLLGNAWKFTGRTEEPAVQVGLERVEGEDAFFVRDNGAGFDMQYASKLFEPFQRLHPQSQFPGSGIGLATVTRVVRRHGGRIWAHGEPGAGAVFYFTLEGSIAKTT